MTGELGREILSHVPDESPRVPQVDPATLRPTVSATSPDGLIRATIDTLTYEVVSVAILRTDDPYSVGRSAVVAINAALEQLVGDDELTDAIGARMDAFDKKLGAITARLDGLGAELDGLLGDL